MIQDLFQLSGRGMKSDHDLMIYDPFRKSVILELLRSLSPPSNVQCCIYVINLETPALPFYIYKHQFFNNSEFSVILLPNSNQRQKRLLVGRKDIFWGKEFEIKDDI